MKRFSLLLISLVIIVSLIFGLSAYASGVPQEVLDASSSVVYIEVESAIGIGSGSGFIVKNGSDGTYIATNNHVIESNLTGVSVWTGKNEKRSATVVEHSEQLDLAILKLAEPISANALILSDNTKQGDEVFAVGYPAAADYLSNTQAHLSSEATITNGIISSIRTTKIIDYGPEVKLLQINADINSGNSGGPLLNAKGQVIGINSYGALESQGIFGAISAGELIAYINSNNLFQISVDEASSSGWFIYCLIGILIAVILICIFIPKFRNPIIRVFKRQNIRLNKDAALNDYLSTLDKPLNAYSIISLIMPILLGLRDKHMQGSVYLKLAPSGIVVTENGFKLSESKDIASDEFYAPEIREGKFAGVRADVYGVCALIMYILNYNYPISAAETPKEPGSAEYELIRIINKGLENKPEDRFGNMQDLISELSPFNRGISDEILQTLNGITRVSQKGEPADTVTETEEKAKTKKKPVLIAIMAVCGLIPGFLVFSAVNYFSAIDCANNYNFEDAYTYINNVALSKDIFADNYNYIDAGYDMVNRNYDSAIQKLESYKNHNNVTDTLTNEAKYRKAAMLADQNVFSESIALYSEIGDYKDSAGLVNDTKFRQANFYLDNKKYLEAVDILQGLSKAGYTEADTLLSGLQVFLYDIAVEYYHNSNYSEAKKYFDTTDGYLRTYDYLSLINLHQQFYITENDVWRTLVPLIGFEDAADLIVDYDTPAISFLLGKWSSGKSYIKFFTNKKGTWCTFDYILGWHGSWSISKGIYSVTLDNKTSIEKDVFMITVLSKNCISLYAYRNGRTYNLYRQ